MKVHQVIDKLKDLDPNMDVQAILADDNYFGIFDSETVANVITRKEVVTDDQVDARRANHPAYRGRPRYKKAIWHVDLHGNWVQDD